MNSMLQWLMMKKMRLICEMQIKKMFYKNNKKMNMANKNNVKKYY